MRTTPTSSRRRNPDAKELLGQIPNSLRRSRYLPALFAFGLDYCGLFLGTGLACIVPTWWAKLLCCTLAGFSIGGLFIVGHDAGHFNLVPSRRLNRVLGRLAFLPAYVPFASWRYTHNVLHHSFLRVRNHDMVWQPWSVEDYHNASTWRRFYYQLLRTPLGFSPYWTLHNWVPRHLLAKPEDLGHDWPQFQWDRVCVAAYAVVMYGLLYGFTSVVAAYGGSWTEPVGPVGVFCYTLVLPYLLWSWLIGFVDYVQHMHPRSVWFASTDEWNYATANLRSSTHIILPFKLNEVWHHVLEHSAHHVDPRVPLYNLGKAQTALEEAYPEDVLVERLTPAYLWRLWKTCRLYDFHKQQWLDYDGTPTAPAQRSLFDASRTTTWPLAEPVVPIPHGVVP